MQPNPLLNNTSNISFGGINSFPPQTVSYKEKQKETWYKPMMDNFEAIATLQYQENTLLDENCMMAKGDFLAHHYEETEENEYVDLLANAQKTFKSPKKLQHFDLIQPIIETLLGEFDGHPDVFRVVAKGENVSNAREREKAEMLMEYVMEQINNEINVKLKKNNLDPERTDFQSEEEEGAYQQQVEQARQALTPPEIQSYFDNKWQHIAEKWANIQLEDDKERHDLVMKERNEFEYFLKTGKCARHFYLTSTGYKQESWRYKDIFYHKSPDTLYPEQGNYIGRTTIMSLSDIIDRFHDVLTQEDLENLETNKGKQDANGYIKDWYGNDVKYTSVEGLPMGVRLPTNNELITKFWPQFKDMTTMNSYKTIQELGQGYMNNMYQLTEAYWKSQKLIGRLYWLNPETNEEEVLLVDETFVVPPFVKKYKGTLFNKEQELNTLETTYINTIYQGKKLTAFGETVTDPIYFDLKECDFQGKSEYNIYEPSFPVVMLAEETPLVTKIKPFQVFHNLFLNQLRLIAEEEILPFVAFDVNTLVKDKDWGGEEGFVKYMTAIRSLRMAPMDTRPHMTNGANSGGQLPAVINLDVTSRMQSRLELAQAAKQLALEQVGFNPQRLAQVKASETATGINQAIQGSYAQTSSLFTKFYNYKKRTLKVNLDFAQFVQSKEKDITVMATKSDRTQAWLKLSGTDLLLTDLHVYVTSTQEEIRKQEFIKKMAVENNTILTKMSDRIEMGTSNSVEQIKEMLKISEEETAQQQKAIQDLEQQKIQSQEKMAQEKMAFEREQNQLDRDAKLEEAYIKTFGYAEDNLSDKDESGQPDIMEYNKFAQKSDVDNRRLELETKRQALAEKVAENKYQTDQVKMQRDDDKFLKEMELQQKKIEQARIQGDKSK